MSNNEDEAVDKNIPDGGYGWIIVGSSFIITFMLGANFIAFAVYLVELQAYFDIPQGLLNWIGALEMFCLAFAGMISSVFINKSGARKLVMLGLTLITVGLFTSSFATNIIVFIILFSFVKGVGCGFLLLTPHIITQQYFTKRRALAAGFSSAGLASGTLFFGPIHRLLIDKFSWRGGLVITAGITLQAVVFAALLRPPDYMEINKIKMKMQKDDALKSEEFDDDSDEVKVIYKSTELQDTSTEEGCLQSIKRSSLSTGKAWAFIISKALTGPCTTYMYKLSTTWAIANGMDPLRASLLISITGLFSMIGRVLSGLIGNLPKVNVSMMYITIILLSAVPVGLSIVVVGNMPWNFIMNAAFGICVGFIDSQAPTVARDFFGLEEFPKILGTIVGLMGLISLTELPFAGMVFDQTDSYTIAFCVAVVLQLVSGALGCTAYYLHRRDQQHRKPLN